MINQDFTNVIKKIAQKKLPKMKCDEKDFYKWQSNLKEEIFALKGADIERAKFDFKIFEEEVLESHIRKKVLIKATEYSDITGYLLVPNNIKGQTPAIIASPGHYKFGKDTVAGHPNAQPELAEKPNSDYGKLALESGYVVFVPDWWGWGDRSVHLGKVGERRDRCNVVQMAASMYGFSVLYLHMLETDAIIDFLQSLDFVASERIAIIGNSYGGRTSMWIGAYNERIKCVVSAGAMNLFSERALKLASCAIQYFPGILNYGDVGEIYSLIAPKPLQLQAGDSDPLIIPSDRDEISKIVKKAYSLSDKIENLSVEIFDGGHLLNWPLAHKFLLKHL